MTVASSEARVNGPYTGNGVTTVFDYDFKVYANTELLVLRTNADGSVETLTPGTHYTVAGVGVTGGGQLTLTSGAVLPTGATMTVEPNITPSQERPFGAQSSATLAELEAALDKLTSLTRQLLGLSDRTPRVKAGLLAGTMQIGAAGAVAVHDGSGGLRATGDVDGLLAAADAAADAAAISLGAKDDTLTALGATEAARDAAIAAAAATAEALARGLIWANDPTYGFDPGNTGTENSAALTAAYAAAAAAGKALCWLPGTYFLQTGLRLRSNAPIVGSIWGKSTLKLSVTADDDECVIQGNDCENGDAIVENVVLANFTVDGNESRSATIGAKRPGGTGICLSHVHGAYVYRVEAHNCKLHGFDVTNGGEKPGVDPREYSATATNTYYPANISKDVYVVECKASNCGDDSFTTHFSDYIWFVRCEGWAAGGRLISGDTGLATPSNQYEADDGSKYVWFLECIARTGNAGFVAKCHDGYPAAMSVTVANCMTEYCARGFYGNDPNAGAPSPSARDLRVINNRITKPAFFDGPSGPTTTDIHGIRVGEYVDAVVEGNHIEGVAYVNDVANSRETRSAILFESATKFRCTNNTIRNWNYDNIVSPTYGAIHVNAGSQGLLAFNRMSDVGYRGMIIGDGSSNVDVVYNHYDNDLTLGAPTIAFTIGTVFEPISDNMNFVGNRDDGADYAMSLAGVLYTSTFNFAANATLSERSPAFSAHRSTDITTTGDFVVTGYNTQHFDRVNDFTLATGVFKAQYKGIYQFHTMTTWRDGDGVDDSMNVGFRVTEDPLGAATIRNMYMSTYNPRANTATGVEDTYTVSGMILLNPGDYVQVYVEGVGAASPCVITQVHFSGAFIS